MLDFRIKLLRYFIAVAEQGSVLKAAGKLGISQPSLSQRIQHLESELGLPLFARIQGRLELTEEGRTILPSARQLIACASRMGHVVADLRVGEAGHLAIGRHATLDIAERDEQIERFIEEFPAIDVVVVSKVYSPDLLESLRTGELDIAFVSGLLPPGEFEHMPIYRCEFGLLLPEQEGTEFPADVPLDRLAGRPIASFRREANPLLYDYVANVIEGAGATLIAPPDAHLAAVGQYAQAHGIAALTLRELSLVKREGLIWRSLEGRPLWMDCSLARPVGEVRPVAMSFWRFMEDALAREPSGWLMARGAGAGVGGDPRKESALHD